MIRLGLELSLTLFKGLARDLPSHLLAYDFPPTEIREIFSENLRSTTNDNLSRRSSPTAEMTKINSCM
jgi:hypothetical protein